jgi:hypothetical protein
MTFQEDQMSRLVRTCIAAAAAAGLAALVSAPSQAQDCRDFAAVGSGLNESIATLMALQGAVNVAEARGYKVEGEAKLISCEATGIFGTECKARSHACKKPL